MSSIFISYTARDHEGDVWADLLVAWCEEWQFGYFRDKDRSHGVMAGDNWRASLHQQLGLAQVVISLCSPSYESSSWCVWELAAAVERGKRVIPIQLGERLVPNLVQNRQVIVVEQASYPSAALLEEVKLRLHRALKEQLDWRALQPWDRSLPPYPGLPAFEAAQAPVFFGRDVANDTVRERLASLAQRSPAFLLLLGASGTGKSSLVRAGILPRLQADRGRWQLLAPFNPGPVPLLRLAQVLQEAWDTLGKSPPSAEAGEREESTLLRQLQWLHATTQTPVLLVVDQFEELLVEQQPEADRFLRFLQEVLRLELSGVVLLATLRSDFLELLQNHCPVLAGMATALPVQPIQSEDFGELILGPAQRSGLTLQPGLQERLVKESGGRDALPLLAFTLEKLWQKRQERGGPVEGAHGVWYDLTLADYQTLGGVTGAVSFQAALCWDPHTSNGADTAALREAFLFHLVRLNEEGLATKQAARWDEIPERSRPLLRRFVKARLVVSGGEIGGDLLEIAHEALLRTWEPLVQWIREGRQELEQRRRMARICVELTLDQPLQARLAALQALQVLAQADPEAAALAAPALADVLTQQGRDFREIPLAIRLLEPMGDDVSVPTLSGFLEQRQLAEPMAAEQALPVLQTLCQAAAALQSIHRRKPHCHPEEPRWLLLPSVSVSDDGRAICTELVRLRLWATPRLQEMAAWFEPLGEGVALTLVAIPAGSFLMGSPQEELERTSDEGPQHKVSLEGFWMSQTPVTKGQWRQVMNSNPTLDYRAGDDREPVVRVSWQDAMMFCMSLSQRTGRQYTLPSEAQWEYACRAGTLTPFHCGSTIISLLANFDPSFPYAKAPLARGRTAYSAVGLFPANEWGLYDLHGNVLEWCLDSWHDNYEGAPTDGRAWMASTKANDANSKIERACRGGAWSFFPRDCRSAARHYSEFSLESDSVGFRVVCLPQSPAVAPGSLNTQMRHNWLPNSIIHPSRIRVGY